MAKLAIRAVRCNVQVGSNQVRCLLVISSRGRDQSIQGPQPASAYQAPGGQGQPVVIHDHDGIESNCMGNGVGTMGATAWKRSKLAWENQVYGRQAARSSLAQT